MYTMQKTDLIFLDTETTGVGPEDRLCQVAYVYQSQEAKGLFRPPLAMTIDAMVVTHITDKTVESCESFRGSQMYQDLEKIFASGGILVAHNAPFDAEMLHREGITVKASIDTFKLSHFLDETSAIPKHSLQYLRYYHHLEVGEAVAHDALGDVRVLEKLFDFHFEQMLAQSSGDQEATLQKMIEISARPILMRKFNFGKYIGMDVKKVADEDADYLTWLFNQKIMTREQGGEDDENWIYTLDYYLNPKKDASLF